MARRQILLLGNPRLYEPSIPVSEGELEDLQNTVDDLHETLNAFRAEHGVGRAIAAPQIGEFKRIVYVNIDEPIVLLNPEIVHHSRETFELWDDCMSFPNLLVKVERFQNIVVEYRDLNWKQVSVEYSDDMSELLQHEIDHLDGILAVQRAKDSRSFSLRSER
ncbi:peptide deformylase [Candidatus Thorarchaeota archaeon]|nr:MAG: peptide deformylase [Candidatus Thorarchaeota archaeon]